MLSGPVGFVCPRDLDAKYLGPLGWVWANLTIIHLSEAPNPLVTSLTGSPKGCIRYVHFDGRVGWGWGRGKKSLIMTDPSILVDLLRLNRILIIQ